MRYSKRTAFYTAIGLALGVVIHVCNSLIGVGLLISNSGIFFFVIKFVGAVYLIYIGYKSVTVASNTHQFDNFIIDEDLPKLKALKMGFITNSTNPKVFISFLSIFTLIVSHSTPLYIKALYGVEMSVAEFSWLLLLSIIISHTFVKRRIGKFQLLAEQIMGVVLIILGIKIILF